MRRRRKPKYEDPADAETQEIKRYSLIISMMPDTPLDLYEINASWGSCVLLRWHRRNRTYQQLEKTNRDRGDAGERCDLRLALSSQSRLSRDRPGPALTSERLSDSDSDQPRRFSLAAGHMSKTTEPVAGRNRNDAMAPLNVTARSESAAAHA